MFVLGNNMDFFSVFTSLSIAIIAFVIGRDTAVIIVYGFIVPILALLPRYLFKISNIRLLRFVGILLEFIILTSALGSLWLHDLGIQYDRLLHMVNVFLATLLTFVIYLHVIVMRSKHLKRKEQIILTIFFVMLVGIFLFEGLQYMIDRIFSTTLFFDVIQNIRVDFWEDIFFGFVGLVVAVVYINYSFDALLSYYRDKYPSL